MPERKQIVNYLNYYCMNAKSFKTSKLDENQVLANFQVEELEKRYEMGWAPSSGGASVSYGSDGWGATVSGTWNF